MPLDWLRTFESMRRLHKEVVPAECRKGIEQNVKSQIWLEEINKSICQPRDTNLVSYSQRLAIIIRDIGLLTLCVSFPKLPI